MIEGRSGTEFELVKRMLYGRPDLLHRILDINTRAVTAYLNAQIEAGAQAVMLFDTWGGVLSHAAYHEFSLRYLEQIVEGLTRSRDGQIVPRIVFTKGGGAWLESIAAIGADAVGLDWTVDIGQARARVGSEVALQGNLDPAVLFSTPEIVRTEAHKVLASFGKGAGHVFNLGHGISQHTAPENVAALVDAVHDLSRPFHAG
jgi:uroporphyrinogen decarboxylase